MEVKIKTQNRIPELLIKVVIPDLNSSEEKDFIFNAFIAPDEENNLMHKNLPFKIITEGRDIKDYSPDFENVRISIATENITENADWNENPVITTTLYAYTGPDQWLNAILEKHPIVLGKEFISQFVFFDNSEDPLIPVIYFKLKAKKD